MKKLFILIIIVILIVSGTEVYSITNSPGPVSTPKCANVDNPCFEITATDELPLKINGWKHYGDTNCVDFTSLPDGDFHGYCGDYQIKYLK